MDRIFAKDEPNQAQQRLMRAASRIDCVTLFASQLLSDLLLLGNFTSMERPSTA